MFNILGYLENFSMDWWTGPDRDVPEIRYSLGNIWDFYMEGFIDFFILVFKKFSLLI